MPTPFQHPGPPFVPDGNPVSHEHSLQQSPARTAQAANAASNNIGIIIGAASGGLLLGVLVTAGVAYHASNRPRRIASPPLYPIAHTQP